MTTRQRCIPALVVVAGAVVGGLGVGGPPMLDALLQLAPLLALAIPLALGRYPGACRLERLLGARARRAVRALRRIGVARPRAAGGPIARGGRLIAESLAKRPPPQPSIG